MALEPPRTVGHPLSRYRFQALVTAAAAGVAAAELSAAAIALLAATIALGVRRMVGGGRAPAIIVAAVTLTGAAIGDARLAAIDRSVISGAVGREATLTVHLTRRPRAGLFDSVARGVISAGAARGELVELRLPIRLRWPELSIGDEIALSGRVTVAGGRPRPGAGAERAEPGSEAGERERRRRSHAASLRRDGVHATIKMSDPPLATGRRRGGAAGIIDAIRRRAERGIAAGLPREAAALQRGMVLGGDEGLTDTTRERFRRAGLTHILAVSGQNVMLLVILAQALLGGLGVGVRARLWTASALVALYVPLCGAGASVVRAGVMGLAGIAAILAVRPTSRAYALALAALVMLVLNPRATGDIGAQLSFAAVIGIYLIGPPLRRRLARRLPRMSAEAMAVTTAATLATAPILAFHFGTLSIVSLAANVVAEPVIAPIVWLGSLSAALAQFAVWPATLLNALSGYLIGCLMAIAAAASATPFATLDVSLASPWQVAVAYLAPTALYVGERRTGLIRRLVSLLAGRRRARRDRPPARHSRRATVAVAAAAIGLTLTVIAVQWARPGRGSAVPRPAIVFIDVGQGDAVLVLGARCSLLIDGGPPGGGVVDRLHALGVRRLDLLLATHPSADHHGGLLEVADHVPVGRLLDGGGATTDAGFLALRRRLAARGVPATAAVAGTRARCGEIALDVLGPRTEDARRGPYDDPNATAVVALVRVGPLRLLTTADAESPALMPLRLPRADVMKAPHHGSADPGLDRVLASVRPSIAVITVGENRYGHPTAQALRSLAASSRVYRTDRDGSVVISPARGGRAVIVETDR